MNHINKIINKTILNRSIISYNSLFKQRFTTYRLSINSKSIVNNNNNNKKIINKNYYCTTSTSTTTPTSDNDIYLNKIKQANQLAASLKLDESIKLLTQAIEIKSNDPNGYINRGKILVIQKKGDEAIKDFERVLELTKPATQDNSTSQENNQQRDQAYHYLAMIQREKGNLNEAIKILDRSLEGDHISLDNIILKAEIYHKTGNYLSAAHIYTLAYSLVDKDSKEISAQFLSYKLTENILVCSCSVLQSLPEVDFSKYLELLTPQDIEFIKSRTESFNDLYIKCNKLRDLISQVIQLLSIADNPSPKDKEVLELLKSIFMAISGGSIEAIKVMTNPVYQNPQMHHPSMVVDEFLFQIYEELIPKYFKL